MLADMDTNRNKSSKDGFDAQVGALLDRVHESASFVDSLMAMPLLDEQDAPREWNTAVTRRLERRSPTRRARSPDARGRAQEERLAWVRGLGSRLPKRR